MICELHYDCAECCESEREAVRLARAESEAQIAALQSERDALKQRIEQLEVQMAGITTVALGWGIKESEIVEKGTWAWSVPYQDVLDLRRKYEALSVPADGGGENQDEDCIR